MENTLLQNDLVEQREGFKIEDLQGANWAFRKLRAITAKEAEIKALAEEERNRINTWEEKLKQKLLKNSNAISLDNGGNFGS